MTPRNTIINGDATTVLKTLASASVDCVISSPPYWLLRDYHVAGQLGLETTIDEWLRRMQTVMVEIARVLTPTGSVWLNLGDTYSRHRRSGAEPKSLLLAPERLALALIADGWLIRNRVTWAKINPMPQAVADRLTTTSDVVFFLTRQRSYHFDLDAIREPYHPATTGQQDADGRDLPDGLVAGNPGDVWRLPAANFRGAHFATFPESLVRRPLLASCPTQVCTACAAPWRRLPGETYVIGRKPRRKPTNTTGDPHVRRFAGSWRVARQLGITQAGCACRAPSRPGLVLDPFFGTGTVGAVAEQHGRDWLGIELNPAYVDLAWERLRGSPPKDLAA